MIRFVHGMAIDWSFVGFETSEHFIIILYSNSLSSLCSYGSNVSPDATFDLNIERRVKC